MKITSSEKDNDVFFNLKEGRKMTTIINLKIDKSPYGVEKIGHPLIPLYPQQHLKISCTKRNVQDALKNKCLQFEHM